MQLEKRKTVSCVGFKFRIFFFNNRPLVWIEFKFVLNYYSIMKLEGGKNLGCVGFKFIKFW